MSTTIRAEISLKNKYHIDKHRHYELKHFCLQYPIWKEAYREFDDTSIPLSAIDKMPTSNLPGDPTAKRALMKAYYSEKIDLVEKAAMEADRYLYEYLIKGAVVIVHRVCRGGIAAIGGSRLLTAGGHGYHQGHGKQQRQQAFYSIFHNLPHSFELFYLIPFPVRTRTNTFSASVACPSAVNRA